MPKKVKVDIDFSQDNVFLGISCHKKDYWIAYHLNDAIGVEMARMDDLPVYKPKPDILINFPLFYYLDESNCNSFYLFPNNNLEGILFPELKGIDYLLLINGFLNERDKTKLIASVKGVNNILAAYEINLSKLKEIPGFLSDLEIHMIEILKKQKR
jgi:hypothetical protein